MNRIIVVISLLIILGCTRSTDVAGGSDNPDFLVGVVVSSDNSPLAGVDVTLIPSNYDPMSESDSLLKVVTTSDDGSFRFDSLDGAQFSIEVIDTVHGIGGIKMGCSPDDNSSVVVSTDSLGAIALLYSDSIDSAKITVCGTTIYQTAREVVPYENGFSQVLFSRIPIGVFDSVTLVVGDSIYVEQGVVVTPNDTILLLHNNSAPSPLRPLWEFPVVAGVSDSMVAHFGGIESVEILIRDQLQRMESLFADQQFNGAYSFPLDSLYIMEGDINSEVTLPPEGFAYRLLYSPFETSALGNVIKATRVAIHDYNGDDGVFGDRSVVELAWEFGLLRGGYYIVKEEVYAVNNSVSGTKFIPDSSIMFLRGEQWDPYSVSLMNLAGTELTNVDDYKHFVGDSVSLSIVDENEELFDTVTVELYGVTPFSLTVSDSLLLSVTTVNGNVTFDAPYLLDDNATLQYSNILIKIQYKSTTTYHWLPYSEVANHFLKSGNNTFSKTIVI